MNEKYDAEIANAERLEAELADLVDEELLATSGRVADRAVHWHSAGSASSDRLRAFTT